MSLWLSQLKQAKKKPAKIQTRYKKLVCSYEYTVDVVV